MAVQHTIRKWNGTRTVSLTPIRAIKLHCIECMGFQAREVEHCTAPLCPLYPFRMGTNPSLKGSTRGASRNSQNEAKKRVAGPIID
jgi:hypothetical protein